MDLDHIRRTVIIAMFSDDILMDQLVLKGGNALSLIYGLGHRSSLDVDLSIEGDFASLEEAGHRIFNALRKQFDTLGCVVFDQNFERRPAEDPLTERQQWGGYVAEFKLMEKNRYNELGGDLNAMRREAMVTGPLSKRTFRVEMSKHEFCEGKTERELDEYTVYVYTPEMLAVEKLRAICQQMPEYQKRSKKTARARDFYDIHTLVVEGKIDFATSVNLDLARNVFDAKEVPLELIGRIPESREFHRPDWPSVQASVMGALRPFDHYFDFVVSETLKLKTLWIVNPPK